MTAAKGALVAFVSIGALAFALLIVYGKGRAEGIEYAQAQANKSAVAALTDNLQQYRDVVTEHRELIAASQHASSLIRSAADAAAHYNRSTTNDLRQLLADTAGERVDCRFDDGVMQQLGTARDRAAAASSGTTPGSAAAGLRAAPGIAGAQR